MSGAAAAFSSGKDPLLAPGWLISRFNMSGGFKRTAAEKDVVVPILAEHEFKSSVSGGFYLMSLDLSARANCGKESFGGDGMAVTL